MFKKEKRKKIIISILLSVLMLFSLSSCTGKEQVEVVNESSNEHVEYVQENYSQTEILGEAGLEVHFIDVGQADSILVLCDGQSLLIDGGNVADSSLIYSYLEKMGINHLNYMICTHAHEDHVGGLAGALNCAQVDMAFSPVTSYSSSAFSNFIKYLEKQNTPLYVPNVGDYFELGSATVTFLGPVNPSKDANNTSLVTRLVYGDTSFIFQGDAEREEEQDILELADKFELSCDVLKVGHHGSRTSSSYPWIRELMPKYAVISVGEGNTYGHPTEDALSRLRDADAKVFRTDLQGTIICKSDGKNISFEFERNSDIDTFSGIGPNSTQKEGNSENTYMLNLSSKKFHYPNCSAVSKMSEKNKQLFTGTREEVINNGYVPCGICKP